MAKEIAEEYTSSLADLTLNSKPLINMLTMLADDNIEHAAAIVQAVETHLDKVRSEFKLPVLYLIDSIVKNVGRAYTSLFTQNIVNSFCSVFEKVDEKVRAQMFKLRQTWSDVFPVKKLYTLDIRVQSIDPAWPIIAPPPTTHNIHPPSNASTAAITVIPAPVIATAAKVAVPLDPQTLDMQTQLINKQKELLELKQKKLELELLQAKAKLEEQQKQLEKQTEQTQLQRHVAAAAPVQVKTTQSQQLLLKPEVAKQLLTANKTEDSTVVVVKNHSVVSTVKSSSSAGTNNVASSGGPRIGPVSSALLANVRPVLRDPRLQRQQQVSATVPSKNSITPSINNHFDNNVNLNVDNKEKVVKSQYKTPNFDSGALMQQQNNHNNKLSSNKINHNNKDPRMINFKLQGSSINVKKSNQNRPTTERSPKSKQTSSSNKSKSSSPSSQSSSRSSIKQQTSPPVVNKTTKPSAGGDSGSKSPQSPSKYKKKSLTTSSPSKLSADKRKTLSSNTTTTKSDMKKSRDKYIENDILTTSTKLSSTLFQQQQVPPSQPKSTSDQDQKFKGLKSSSKNRNYMRRNRTISISPEPPSATKDVDLRVPPEKIPRLTTTTTKEDEAKSTTIDENPSNKDVDLRTLVVPAPISKKRSSTEKLDGSSNAKKSKSQMFDVLFGNEDVDLRQLPSVLPTATVQPVVKSPPSPVTPVSIASTVNRPPTPPPPIISTPPNTTATKERATTPTQTKETTAAKEIKSNFDAIRAKLANATKSTFNEDVRKTEDTDMRTSTDALQKIIISQADEQLIRNGNLSQALVEKVLTMFETQKLQEAKRRESETDAAPNVTLQPISDDELSVDFSHSESEEELSSSSSKMKRKTDLYGDTDERIPPPAPVISQQQNEDGAAGDQQQQRLQKRGQDAWHSGSGHHRRRRMKSHWEPQHSLQQNVQSQQHQQQEQWTRMPHNVMNQGGMYRRGGAPFPVAPPYMRPPPPGEGFGPMMDVLPPLMMQSSTSSRSSTSSPPIIIGGGTQTTKELPLADPLVLEYINQDSMRTINIDGAPREIRYYEETAIAMLAWDDPREISFQPGTRKITFDDKESYTLAFNEDYKNLSIGGHMHRIRLGAPTRELYIDNKFYECYFGGQGIGIDLDGKMHVVKMEGPPPCVRVGTAKRTDLVAGKINLIINARQLVPVFLDAKPQKFDIEGKIHTLRFVDALRTVLINEIPFKVEFGGLPKPITVHNKKHFIRFSVLPKGIKPGYITIANMEGSRCPSPNHHHSKSDHHNNDGGTTTMMMNKNNDNNTIIEHQNNVINPTEPALPMYRKRLLRHDRPESPEDARISPQPQGLDVLSSMMTSPMVNNASSNMTGYQVEKGDNTAAMDTNSQDSSSFINNKPNDNNVVSAAVNEAAVATVSSGLPTHLNINDLFQKLIASGIVTSTKEPAPSPPAAPAAVQRQVEEPVIRPVLFTHPETLKIKQQPLVLALYSGMQCSSCGVRFPSEHTKQYSQHLDWHFRQNRRGKNSARKALCRKWYYDVSDWKNYEEIEDIEEREKNWFESQQQQQQAEGGGPDDGDEEIEIPSVPADSQSQDARCEVCHDPFEQFYNEEKEEWHLRMAIRVDDKTYHPLCYDDYKASLIDTSLDDPHSHTESKDDIKPDDDDIELLQSEEIKDESDVKIEEIKDEEPEVKMDEDNQVEEETTQEKMDVIEEEDDDDDVVIQEPNIVQIEIDDKMDVDVRTTDSDDVIFQSGIFIKQEPIDDDVDINLSDIKTEVIDPETETVQPMIAADTTHAELVSSIDGNVQMSSSSGTPTQGSILGGGKIKINITKPIPASKENVAATVSNQQSTTGGEAELSTIVPPITSDEVANEPLPPGEEPVQLNLKPALQGLTLLKQPPVTRGTELTGLCSIM